MRSFTDAQGREWEVSLGRESWGTFVALFSPREGGEVRKAAIGAETMLDAQRELDAMPAADLGQRLADSEPWS